MLDLEKALAQAWEKVFSQLKSNPDKLRQRLQRCRSGVVTRPIRPWCLALRASDHRIPLSAMYRVHGVKAKNVVEVTILNKESAGVEITAELLRSLNRPVHLPSPGVDLQNACSLLGSPRCANPECPAPPSQNISISPSDT